MSIMSPNESNFNWWNEARERFECKKHQPEIRYFEKKNGSIEWREQCVVCGGSLSTIKATDVSPQAKAEAKPFDRDLSANHTDQMHTWVREQDQKAREQKNAEWWANYNAYLLSPRWARIRSKVMERAHGVCEGCRENPAVQVHHLTYNRVGNEMLFDLVAVCHRCHEAIHSKVAA